MSITISQSPTGYPSAHGEVWHVVESTNKVVAGFQYVFDIYKSGNLVTRVKNSPYGTGKYGVLDVGNIVRASLESGNVVDNLDAFAFDATEQMGSDQFWTEYDVRYGEVSGGVTSANIASGTYRVYNNYSRNVWDRKGSDLSGAMILSNRPTDSYWYAGEPVVLSVFLPSGQTYARQEKYNGSVQNEYTHTGNGNAFRWSLSGGQMVEKVGYAYNEASKVYAGSYKEKMQLTSDILSTGEYDWLSELINSPLVYLLNSTTQDFYPVIITDSNYEFKDERINKTDTLTVNIEFSVGNNVQFR